jgi:hypothetical protein
MRNTREYKYAKTLQKLQNVFHDFKSENLIIQAKTQSWLFLYCRDEGRPTVIMIAANAADSIFQSLLEEHPDTTLR